MRRDDRFDQLVDMRAGEARDGDDARALELRQQPVGLVAQFLRLVALVVDQVPFVEADDQRPALALDEIGERQVLLLERDRRVEQQDHDLGEAHRAQRVGDRELLELLDDSRAPPQARRVEEFELAALPSVSMPIESRVMPGSGPVSSRSSPRMRLSSVDLPALGRPSTAMRSGFVGSSSLPSSSSPRTSGFAVVLLVRIESGGGRQGVDAARHRARRGPRRARRKRRSGRRGRGRRRRRRRRARARPSALLATRMIGLPARRTAAAKWRSVGGDPGAGVDEEEDRVAVGERGLGLRAHAARRASPRRLPRAPPCR